jgi:hypothetical protein
MFILLIFLLTLSVAATSKKDKKEMKKRKKLLKPKVKFAPSQLSLEANVQQMSMEPSKILLFETFSYCIVPVWFRIFGQNAYLHSHNLARITAPETDKHLVKKTGNFSANELSTPMGYAASH